MAARLALGSFQKLTALNGATYDVSKCQILHLAQELGV